MTLVGLILYFSHWL